MKPLRKIQPERSPQPSLFLVPPSPLRPPLKWAGGKRWQVPFLKEIWADHTDRRLVEPFCGGLAVALGLEPVAALLADVNLHLINFYQQLQAGFVPKFDWMQNDESVYYRARTEFNSLVLNPNSNPRRRAELFYYLNRTGFNGLCRFNRSGLFNVPFGRYSTINYQRDFSRFKEVFRPWVFLNESFRDLKVRPEDFIYADPPYDVQFTAYSSGGFTWKDQVATAEWLAQHEGPVVLVNQSTPRIRKLYSSLGFNIEFVDAPRRISCDGDRTAAKEVIATRNV